MKTPGISDATKALVAAATVELTRLHGQGVLVRGSVFLTAAHCVECNCNGAMALGEYFVEPISTAGGKAIKASVIAAEPVADIAALGPMDDQSAAEECMAFYETIENMRGLRLFTNLAELSSLMPVWIRTHTDGWIAATVHYRGLTGSPDSARVILNSTLKVEGGTSGGPVVDSRGRLVGVISNSTEEDRSGRYSGQLGLACLALPRWLVDYIEG